MNTQWLDAAYRAVASLSLLPMILRVYLIAFLEMLFIAWHHLRSSIRADVKTRALIERSKRRRTRQPPLAVVTGGDTGIGLEACRGLLQAGFRVVIASLHASQADAALASLGESGFGPSVVSYSQLDLADFDSISLFVDRLKKEEHSKIALLVCNAAKMDLPFSLDSNGVELHISTNFLGHAKLIFDLLPTLARKARIVNLGSSAHHAARHLDLAPTPANYSRLGSYAVSKSCVAMYSIHTLAPVLRRNGIKVLVVHPGVIPTDLYASNPFGIGALFRLLRSHPILSAPLRLLMLSEREGAWTILDACLGDHETGEYLAYGQSCRPSKLVLSKSECRRLEKWTGKMLER